jgi:hypothetical protein
MVDDCGRLWTIVDRNWWANDQPSYVSNPADANYGRCLGWNHTPTTVPCSGAYSTTNRLCRCDKPRYFLGATGESCTQTCQKLSLTCNPAIQTGNSVDLFKSLGVTCVADSRFVGVV